MDIDTEAAGAAGRSDRRRRFIFEHMDLRGELVHLDAVLKDIRATHHYAPAVGSLLGEFIAASVLLASTLKFRGTLTVQARSERQVPLIMAECNSRLEVRGIARGADGATGQTFAELLGEGQLALTMTPERGRRYQGIVPLNDRSLAASIDSYFAQSEQLHTCLYLAADGGRAAGMLLQQLPMQRVLDPALRADQWRRVNALAATLTDAELLDIDDATLLHRLFHEDDLRLLGDDTVRFRCSCSQDRTLAALATIGEAEVRSILDEQGAVTMDCEFCNQRYVFREEHLRGLLERPGAQPLH
jgi:molecular chaperone Hsp33